MIDPRIQWPVRVVYPTDPELNHEAIDPRSLEMNVEYWNCVDLPESGPTILRDRQGRLLTGVICALEVQQLAFDESANSTNPDEWLDTIVLAESLEDRLAAVIAFQYVEDAVAVASVTSRFGPHSDTYTLMLAISLLAGRATSAHRDWLASLQPCKDKSVAKAAIWALSLIDDRTD
ncbi:MAG: hypothetical protein ABIV13_04140 [Fimbriimonadales bacterium]